MIMGNWSSYNVGDQRDNRGEHKGLGYYFYFHHFLACLRMGLYIFKEVSMEENNEELAYRVKQLEERVNELSKIIAIMKRDHSFDMGRVFEEIDKINGEVK